MIKYLIQLGLQEEEQGEEQGGERIDIHANNDEAYLSVCNNHEEVEFYLLELDWIQIILGLNVNYSFSCGNWYNKLYL